MAKLFILKSFLKYPTAVAVLSGVLSAVSKQLSKDFRMMMVNLQQEGEDYKKLNCFKLLISIVRKIMRR